MYGYFTTHKHSILLNYSHINSRLQLEWIHSNMCNCISADHSVSYSSTERIEMNFQINHFLICCQDCGLWMIWLMVAQTFLGRFVREVLRFIPIMKQWRSQIQLMPVVLMESFVSIAVLPSPARSPPTSRVIWRANILKSLMKFNVSYGYNY